MSGIGRGELPSGEAKSTAVRAMFDAIAPRYDLVNRVMTFRMDVGWRRRTVEVLGLQPPAIVVDAACGTGDLCRVLEDAGHRAVGLDFSAGMLAAAHTSAPLVQGDALALPFKDGVLDGITCGFALRNVVSLPRLFSEAARVLRDAGRIALLEVAHPRAPIPRALHAIYFNRVVPLIGGLLSDRGAYSYLPRSAAYLPDEEDLESLLHDAGFVRQSVTTLGFGAAQVVSATRRARA